MKFPLCVLFAVALVPATLAGDQQPSSLWELIREKVGLGVAPSPHVFGGEETVPHAFPFQVAVQLTFSPGSVGTCGGSLIAPEWVLTAAHCVNVYPVHVLLGSHNVIIDSEEGRQSIRPSQVFVHEGFNTHGYDIALLKLERPAELNQFVQPIRMPSRSLGNRDLSGTPAEFTGWGIYADPKYGPSAVLRHARTGIWNNQACRDYGYGDGITDWRMCSDGSYNKGACTGDSGGPLFITEDDGQRTLVGITAFRKGPSCGYPCVFTRVSSFLEWISRVTGLPIRD